MVSSKEIAQVFSLLETTHPLTMLELLSDYTPFQRLVMTLLSARSKDSTVIPLVKELFKKYPDARAFSHLEPQELEKEIYTIGFYRQKAKHVVALSHILLERFGGEVPDTLEELTSLPGVGRKTANCVLAYVFGKPAIAVDIHVHRIANRLGWITTDSEKESEFALMDLVPKAMWIDVNRLLVGHGQSICSPRKPSCELCPVRAYCAYGQSLS